MGDGYIIRELIVRQFKAARRVTIYNAGPGVIEVTGENEAGKTSTLQALPALLAGLGYKDGRSKLWDGHCLTRGAVKGQLTAVLAALDKDGEAELDGLTITRKFTAENQHKGGSLLIKAADGSRRKQGDLNAIFNAFSFDPTEWFGQSLEDKVRSLNELVDHDVASELRRLDDQIEEAEDERRRINREIKTYGRIDDLPKVEPVDTADLMRELDAANRHNREQDRRARELDGAWDRVEGCQLRIADIEVEIGRLRKKLEAEQAELEKLVHHAEELPGRGEIIDTAHMQDSLASAGEQNAKAEQWRQNEAKRAELAKLSRQSSAFDRSIEDLREDRRQKALEANVPIDGLEWGPRGVVWNGTPEAKLSASQRLRLSAQIEMARHPQLRVMIVRNGDLLDDKRFAELCELAKEMSYQIWVESVRGARTDDAVEIVLGNYGSSEPWDTSK